MMKMTKQHIRRIRRAIGNRLAHIHTHDVLVEMNIDVDMMRDDHYKAYDQEIRRQIALLGWVEQETK